MSFQPYGRPVLAAGMAADERMTLFVDDQTPVWSPASRHDCAIASPHSHGCATPHSHMEKAMARPVALSAADMFAYSGCGLFLNSAGTKQKSCFTQSTPHSAKTSASCCQWPKDPGRPPTHVSRPLHV